MIEFKHSYVYFWAAFDSSFRSITELSLNKVFWQLITSLNRDVVFKRKWFILNERKISTPTDIL